jgi:hypothetical protein
VGQTSDDGLESRLLRNPADLPVTDLRNEQRIGREERSEVKKRIQREG